MDDQRIRTLLENLRVKRMFGEVFYSYLPTREVFLGGKREGMTQEQFEQKVNNSRRKVAEILGRCITPRGKGYKAVRGQAWKEFAAMMPPGERETR